VRELQEKNSDADEDKTKNADNCWEETAEQIGKCVEDVCGRSPEMTEPDSRTYKRAIPMVKRAEEEREKQQYRLYAKLE